MREELLQRAAVGPDRVAPRRADVDPEDEEDLHPRLVAVGVRDAEERREVEVRVLRRPPLQAGAEEELVLTVGALVLDADVPEAALGAEAQLAVDEHLRDAARHAPL